jgi:hypothetical protein
MKITSIGSGNADVHWGYPAHELHGVNHSYQVKKSASRILEALMELR